MILIDSNIWIFAENDNAEEAEAAGRKVKNIITSEEFGINSIITSEVFYKLSPILGTNEAYSRMLNILDHSAAKWLDIGNMTARRAVRLSKDTGVRINDALIAQQALDLGIPVLTDNVKDFRRIKGLRIVPLR